MKNIALLEQRADPYIYPVFKGTALSDPNRHSYLRWVEYDENDKPVLLRQLQ